LRTILLALAFVAASSPALAAIEVWCKLEAGGEMRLRLDQQNVGVEFFLSHFDPPTKAATFPVYNTIGKVSLAGNAVTLPEIVLGEKLPPENERNWTVYFGDHGQNSLAMSLIRLSANDTENGNDLGQIVYVWRGKLKIEPAVEGTCSFFFYN
jgi:hypothetical protein